MSTPSLLIVPARLKAGTLFSQIPTNGDGDFTVTRASGGVTRVNASGLIESAKTNLILQSEDFLTIWAQNGLNITSGFTSPFDNANGTLIEALSNAGRLRQTIAVITSGTTHTFSLFAKADNLSLTSGVTLTVNDGTSTNYTSGVCQAFRLDTGVLGTSGTVGAGFTLTRASIENYGNGWYRCNMTVTASYTPAIGIVGVRATSVVVSGLPQTVVGNKVYIWGAQLETGSSPSDYIPTTTVERTKFSGVTVNGTSIADIPRLDYYTSSGTPGCPGLLIEPSAQNLAFHSENWTSNWNGGTASGTTVVTGSAISLAPDGTATANEIYPTSGNTNHVRQSNGTTAVTYTSGTIYTQSAFFKAGVGVGTRIQLTFNISRFTQEGYANFDLSAGTLLVLSGTTADTNRAARIENYGNGWYRCSLTATCNSAGAGTSNTATLINASGATRNPSFSGTVTDYVLGWGAQLETGSVATSYIPTTTAAITRNADVISVSGAVSGSIGQTEGTMYCEFSVDFNNRDADILSVDGGSTSDGFFMGIRSSSVVQLIVRTASANALIFQRTGAYPTGVNKLAIAYKNGDFAICLNGTTVQTNTSSITMPSVSINRVSIRRNSLYNLDRQLRIRSAALYTTRLSNTQLALLTSPYTSYSQMASALSYTLG